MDRQQRHLAAIARGNRNPAGPGQRVGAERTVRLPGRWAAGVEDGGVVSPYFLYDGDTPIAELDASGNPTVIDTVGATGTLSRSAVTGGPADTSTFYVFDPQGSVAERTDGGGERAERSGVRLLRLTAYGDHDR